MKDFKIEVSADQIFNQVIDALATKKPLYHLRCGDGEMIVLSSTDKAILGNFLMDQLNCVISEDLLKIIRANLESSIREADLLGLPEEHHKQTSKWWDCTEQTFRRIFIDSNVDVDQKVFCSINSHFQPLYSDFLGKMIRSVDNIVLLTGRDIREPFLRRYPNIRTLEIYTIPPEQKYEIQPKPSNFFPDIHDYIKRQIESKDRSGQLCLYGTGFAGKDLGLTFKHCGGVAIDLGSVFDSWAGKNTRGPTKGPTSYTDTYKL